MIRYILIGTVSLLVTGTVWAQEGGEPLEYPLKKIGDVVGFGRQTSQNTVEPVGRPGNAVERTTTIDLADWFERNSGYVPDTYFFGAYVLQPVYNELYVGFGAARPAESDGSLLARFDGTDLQVLYQPTEQGFIDITPAQGMLYIPGADPCCDDGWELGNVYSFSPWSQTTVKNRSLPNVIHTWGIWASPDNRTLYTAVSSHMGDNRTYTGEVFRSYDRGRRWERLANGSDEVGEYRTYDIHGLDGRLFLTWNDDYYEPCGIAYSKSQGSEWTRFASLITTCRQRLNDFNDELIVLKHDLTGLYTVNPRNGRTRVFLFPDFQVPQWSYNYMTTDNNGRAYFITDGSKVMRTSDLRFWEEIASFDAKLITIAYWPWKNQIIVASRGEDAELWTIDIDP